MPIHASQLRKDIYNLLDQVLETGVPVEIERRGRLLQIVAMKSESKLDRLARRTIINGDPENLVHLDWSAEWKP